MANYDFDIGILGAGAAGLTIASGAAQLGAKTLLIEKEDRLGGTASITAASPARRSSRPRVSTPSSKMLSGTACRRRRRSLWIRLYLTALVHLYGSGTRQHRDE